MDTAIASSWTCHLCDDDAVTDVEKHTLIVHTGYYFSGDEILRFFTPNKVTESVKFHDEIATTAAQTTIENTSVTNTNNIDQLRFLPNFHQ